MVLAEVLVQNQEEDFQVLLVDIHRVLHPVDNPENRVIHPDHPFQVNVRVVNQVGNNLDFHRANNHPVGILVDVPRFLFRVANQRADLVQDIHPLPVHRVGQVRDQEDFHRDQDQGILAADLVAKHQVFQVDQDFQAVDLVNQKVLDIPVDKLLEVIPVKHKSLVREVDILVKGQVLAIQEVLRDLAVVQVLKDQADIQDQEDLKVLEVRKAHLAEVFLQLDQELKDQEAIQVDQEDKDQEVIRVVRAVQLRKDQAAILADQDRKGQEASLAVQVLKDQKDSQVDQVRRDQKDFQAGQAL